MFLSFLIVQAVIDGVGGFNVWEVMPEAVIFRQKIVHVNFGNKLYYYVIF